MDSSSSQSKIIIEVFGRSQTGRSSLVRKLTGYFFEQEYRPTGIDYYHKTVEYDNRQYKLEFEYCNIHSQEEFPALEEMRYQGKNKVYLFLFNPFDKSSLAHLNSPLQKVLAHNSFAPTILVAAKCDLIFSYPSKDVISSQKGLQYAKKTPGFCGYFETSALESRGLNELLQGIAQVYSQSVNLATPKKSPRGLFSSISEKFRKGPTPLTFEFPHFCLEQAQSQIQKSKHKKRKPQSVDSPHFTTTTSTTLGGISDSTESTSSSSSYSDMSSPSPVSRAEYLAEKRKRKNTRRSSISSLSSFSTIPSGESDNDDTGARTKDGK